MVVHLIMFNMSSKCLNKNWIFAFSVLIHFNLKYIYIFKLCAYITLLSCNSHAEWMNQMLLHHQLKNRVREMPSALKRSIFTQRCLLKLFTFVLNPWSLSHFHFKDSQICSTINCVCEVSDVISVKDDPF